MRHLSDAEIVYLASDHVGDAERGRMLNHLEECNDCVSRLAACLKAIRNDCAEDVFAPGPILESDDELDDADGVYVLPAAASVALELPSFPIEGRACVLKFFADDERASSIWARLLTSDEWFGSGATLEFTEPPCAFRFDEDGRAALPGISAGDIRRDNFRVIRDPRPNRD